MLPAHSPCGLPKAGRTIACLLALLSCVTLRTSQAGAADDALAPVVVEALQGDVSASVDNHPVSLKIGSAVPLPVAVVVGKGGSLELHQGQTVIRAAENSRLEFPRSHDASETLDRVIQSSGNVLYSVAKRPVHKLQIGTPYLVAVIKGTQFNVSVQSDSVTLSLLEGRIEVRSSKSADIVQMESGQMAISSELSPAIRVVSMSTGDILRSGRPQTNQVAAATTGTSTTAQTAGVGTAGVSAAVAGVTPSVVGTTASNAGLTATGANTVATKSPGAIAEQGDDRGASSVLMLNGLLAHTSVDTGSNNSSTAGAGASTGTSPPVTAGTGTGPSGGGTSTAPSPPVTAGTGTGPSAPGAPTAPSPPVTAGTGTGPSGPGTPTAPSPPVAAGTATGPSGPATSGSSTPGGDDDSGNGNNGNGNSGKGNGKGNNGNGKGNGGSSDSLQAQLQALLGKLKK
jgi:hypothetical protein